MAIRFNKLFMTCWFARAGEVVAVDLPAPAAGGRAGVDMLSQISRAFESCETSVLTLELTKEGRSKYRISQEGAINASDM